MLKKFDEQMRLAAELVANVDRDVRKKLVRVRAREDRYSEKFVTLLDERLSNFSGGNLVWQVSTHISDKQSGQETATGSDLFISITIDGQRRSVKKGIQAQAKVNKNKRCGLSVDSKPRLVNQCKSMLCNSESSFVFAYGEETTKVLSARSVLEAGKNSIRDLKTQPLQDFFYAFFVCRIGDQELYADNDESLQELVNRLHSKYALRISVSDARGGSG